MDMKKAVEAYATHPEQMQKVAEKIQEILVRSATDLAFRQRLLADPRATVAEFTGRSLSDMPESFNVKFVENKAGVTIVLPDPIDGAAELSEQELEAVAGGTGTPCVASLIWCFAELLQICY